MPDGNLDEPPAAWAEIDKYGVQMRSGISWRATSATRTTRRRLKNLLIRLLVSDLDHACRAPLPEGLKHLVLSRQGTANAVVCLAQWRDSSTRGTVLRGAVRRSGRRRQAGAASRRPGDRRPGGGEDLPGGGAGHRQPTARPGAGDGRDLIKPEAIRDIASRRQDGYWAIPRIARYASAPRRALHAVYQALQTAADLFALRNEHAGALAPAGREGPVRRLHRASCTASTNATATSARPRTMPRPATGTS